MGCLFAAGLVGAGCEINLLLRRRGPTTSAAIKVNSEDKHSSYPVVLEDASGSSSIEHLLVSTKANDMLAAVKSVAHRLQSGVPVILAANGMGYREAIEALLPDNPVFCCLSTEGAYRLAPLHIRHAGHGHNWLGSPAGLPCPDWFTPWQRGPLHSQWQDDIVSAQWHKLAINCAINPLTALHRCRNGQLLQQPELHQQVTLLCEEISHVSAAAGFGKTAATLYDEAIAVITATAENRSSMLQDVQAGRSTEIDFITGYLMQTAASLEIAVPHNQKLFREVQALGH